MQQNPSGLATIEKEYRSSFPNNITVRYTNWIAPFISQHHHSKVYTLKGMGSEGETTFLSSSFLRPPSFPLRLLFHKAVCFLPIMHVWMVLFQAYEALCFYCLLPVMWSWEREGQFLTGCSGDQLWTSKGSLLAGLHVCALLSLQSFGRDKHAHTVFTHNVKWLAS